VGAVDGASVGLHVAKQHVAGQAFRVIALRSSFG
jgi:hypothetical protein